MQHVEQPTLQGFYWFRRPPYTKGFWWQKKNTVTPDWEMCFINYMGMKSEFAVIVGHNKPLPFDADVEWYGPIAEVDELYALQQDRDDLHTLQQANLERVKTD